MITVAAWDPGVQLLTALQTGCLTSGFTSLYPVFPDRVIIGGNFRKIIEDKYIKVSVLLSSSSTSTKYLKHRILSDSPFLMPACSEMLKNTIKSGSQKKFLDVLEIAAEFCSERRMSGGSETCCPRTILLLNSICTPLISAGRMFSDRW